ncbi:diguanylate cyclase (GGDEF)-like protein [Paenibacillus phyllosphaerae]|uniref:Diguanylate cyclase (GGDEF)-like protein n=1 Tax=Paenibacillus phyllosphaerae TaxID=274593 RepID=A0A7W5B002_9BACL|nr:diguanylate cyclase [Paenibacillus phyllosphaerae]MBB3111579.1 diguanylate cyclase (GGDEF)-like protein [Paenibacillus phyllosphaerae]
MFYRIVQSRLPASQLGSRFINHTITAGTIMFLLFTLIVIGMLTWLNYQYRSLQAIELMEDNLSGLQLALTEQETAERGFLLTGDEAFLDHYRDGAEQYAKYDNNLVRDAQSLDQYTMLLDKLIQTGFDWHNLHAEALIASELRGEAITDQALIGAEISMNQFRDYATEMTSELKALEESERESLVTNAQLMLVVVLVLIGVTSLLKICWTIRNVRVMTRPISMIEEQLSRYTKGDFSAPLPQADQVHQELSNLVQNFDRMRSDLQHELATNEGLLSLIGKLQSSLTPSDVFDQAVSGIAKLIDCQSASVVTRDRDGTMRVHKRYVKGVLTEHELELKREDAACCAVFFTRQPLFWNSWISDPPTGKVDIALQQEFDIRSSIHVPIFGDNNEIVIVLNFSSPQENFFDTDKIRLVMKIVPLFTVAIHNAMQFEKTSNLARIDGLTGVSNRGHFNIELERCMEAYENSNKGFTLILLDIDKFKAFNDNYGHVEGDRLLCHIANILKENVRATDIVARYGGEEFVILLPDAGLENGVRRAERIRRKIMEEKLANYEITSSLGVASVRAGDDSISVIERADQALYLAKQSGRNKVKASD